MHKVKVKQNGKGFLGLLIFWSVLVFFTSEEAFAQRMGGGGGGCCGGGGGSIIDPPPGSTFKDPAVMPNLSTTPGIVRINLDVKKAVVNINGTNANLTTYNGCYPGPTIKVKRGDRLYVHFINSLPYTTERNILDFERNHTNLHVHGWHVSPLEPSDAAHIDIAAGNTYDYEYDLSLLEPANLCLYHTHKHGLVAEQYWSGLVGALLTEDENTLLAGYETHIMMLKDISLSGSDPASHAMMKDYMSGKEGSIIMVNGLVNPVLTGHPGQIQRWRIVNASNARFYKLSLANHTFQLIGTDGGLLDKPYPVSQILLSPAERVDVLVKFNASTGSYKLLSLPYARMGMGGMGGGGGMGGMSSAQITLLTVNSTGPAQNQNLPASIDPAAKRLEMDTSTLTKRTLTLSMGMGRGYINGQDFDVDPYMIMSDVDSYEVWEIINDSGMDHPFHQHVNAAQVLNITGGDADYANLYTRLPAMKDVVIVPRNGKITLLMPIKDFTGMTMFHCHILEHEDIGMMGMWHLMGMY